MKSLRASDTNLLVLVQRKMTARVRRSLKRQALRSERNTADEWLLWGAVPRASSPLLAWRAEELISRRNRTMLARCVRRFLAELGDPRCRAYAVNRPAMRAHSRALLELAVRLEAADRPVSPAGIVLAQRLLRDGAGPFFDPDRADELGPAIHAALDALEPDPR